LRLAKAFGTSPKFWLNGQLALDLYRVINDNKEIKEVEELEPVLH
jgi:plasmid maintenance system antidote protein VapI